MVPHQNGLPMSEQVVGSCFRQTFAARAGLPGNNQEKPFSMSISGVWLPTLPNSAFPCRRTASWPGFPLMVGASQSPAAQCFSWRRARSCSRAWATGKLFLRTRKSLFSSHEIC